MTRHPFTYLAIFLTVPLALGCLIAPWVYLGIQELAHLPVFSEVAGDRFERVATRCVQVIALLLVWPCLRHSGTVDRVAPYLRWDRRRGGAMLRWFGLGVATVVVVYAAGLWSGNYVFQPRYAEFWRTAVKPLEILVGALLVGVLEEYLFRGFIFGVLRSRFSFATAALVSSLFFSGIHFLRPRLAAPPEPVTWLSGFDLFPHMFTLFRPAYDWDFALTLFLMGLTLCALLARHGHFYGIAGLHAGWVWALQTGSMLVSQEPRHHDFWFGWGNNAAQGALVSLAAFAFAVWAWRALCAYKHCQHPPVSSTTGACLK
ncbi:MAG TPA: CPBP family intramembrane metalloprotease [Kiritimatiellia bacterium]|nr:CPBP family intramembrane metalloprotease [Kiritimatiellia bacterium]